MRTDKEKELLTEKSRLQLELDIVKAGIEVKVSLDQIQKIAQTLAYRLEVLSNLIESKLRAIK